MRLGRGISRLGLGTTTGLFRYKLWFIPLGQLELSWVALGVTPQRSLGATLSIAKRSQYFYISRNI